MNKLSLLQKLNIKIFILFVLIFSTFSTGMFSISFFSYCIISVQNKIAFTEFISLFILGWLSAINYLILISYVFTSLFSLYFLHINGYFRFFNQQGSNDLYIYIQTFKVFFLTIIIFSIIFIMFLSPSFKLKHSQKVSEYAVKNFYLIFPPGKINKISNNIYFKYEIYNNKKLYDITVIEFKRSIPEKIIHIRSLDINKNFYIDEMHMNYINIFNRMIGSTISIKGKHIPGLFKNTNFKFNANQYKYYNLDKLFKIYKDTQNNICLYEILSRIFYIVSFILFILIFSFKYFYKDKLHFFTFYSIIIFLFLSIISWHIPISVFHDNFFASDIFLLFFLFILMLKGSKERIEP